MEIHVIRKSAVCRTLLAVFSTATLLAATSTYAANPPGTNSGGSATGTLQQQPVIQASGTVVDSKGEALIGASVVLKGSSETGTITDVDGHFQLNVPSNATLVVSYVGFLSQEVKAGNSLHIVLKEDAEQLQEVVVVGYGTQKKENLTGAVASVDVNKTIDSRPITDIGRALQGAVPGLVVSTSSGEIGSAPTIKIRGSVGSPNGSANPLILVDNVEITDISLVNPDDIESISVLKDAASASIYGARGAFGVLLITTKTKVKQERLSVKYSNNFAWRTPTVKPTQLPGWQQADINLQGVENSVGAGNFYNVIGNLYIDRQTINDMKAYWDKYGFGNQFGPELVEGRDFTFDGNGMHMYRTWDWYDMYVKNWMPQQSHNLSLNGGNGKTSYNISLGYLHQEGLTKVNADNYSRYNGNFSMNSDLNRYVSIRAALMYTRADRNTPFTYNSDLYDYMYYLYRWQPVYPYGTLDGKPFRSALTELETAPMVNQRREYVRLSGGVTLKPVKGLTIDLDGIYNTTETQLHKYGTPSLVSGYNIFSQYNTLDALKASYGNYVASTYDYVREEFGRTETLTANLVATYQHRWGDHDFKAMAGSNIEKSAYKYFWTQRMGLLSTGKPELNLATGDITNSSEHTWWAVAGFFGRLNYSYKDRYLLELNGRYDGSSRFPSGQRFGFFPSMSAGYRISEEDFMSSLKPYLSTLKLRVSWGSIGNQDVGTDRFVSTIGSAQDSWIIDNTFVQSTQKPTIVSSELRWEKVSTIDVGFDARFFNEALGVTFDWYNRRTSNILTVPNLPNTLGASAPYQNMGAISTPGWELAVDYRHTFKNNLKLGVTASLSDYKTHVSKWTNNTGIPAYGSGGAGWWSSSYYKEGMTLGDIWGLQFDRFLNQSDFDADGKLKADLPDMTQIYPSNYRFAPGDILYKDLDGDKVITKGVTTDKPGDLSIIGNALPRYQIGFNVDAAWKGFDFNIFFQGVLKRNMWAAGNQVLPGFTSGEPYYKGAEDYWTPDNQDAFYARPMVYGQSQSGNYSVNDHFLLNMAYLRCKTLTFGYSLPKDWISRVRIQNLRVYFTAENLFTFSGVKPDIDPEIGIRVVGSSSDARNFGRSYPYQKSLSFGIQLSL
ncbi:MAG: TonB-dependent receptor [Prevotellaceae bacterium]|jgi:TonB-linked SusC/RagA family outer membrane protein|nr:TonB-dependent receptor [Prevotellaceae bacterium]